MPSAGWLDSWLDIEANAGGAPVNRRNADVSADVGRVWAVRLSPSV